MTGVQYIKENKTNKVLGNGSKREHRHVFNSLALEFNWHGFEVCSYLLYYKSLNLCVAEISQILH